MTSTPGSRYADDVPPRIDVEPVLRTGAGSPARVVAVLTNRAAEPRVLAITAIGVDAGWLPPPTRSEPVPAGGSVHVTLTFVPSLGTLPARYPLALTVQAVDPHTGGATSSAALAELVLVVDARGQLDVSIAPDDAVTLFRKKIRVSVRNTGPVPEIVRLQPDTPEVIDVSLARDEVVIDAGGEAVVRGSVRVRPRWFGHRSRFTYLVIARAGAAPRRAEAAITSRAFLGANGPKAFALLALVALWAGLAIFFIPRLSTTIRHNAEKASDKISGLQSTVQNKAQNKVKGGGSGGSGGGNGGSGGNSGGGSGSGGSGGGGSGGGGSGGGGSGGGGGGAAGTAGAANIQLSGTVTGNAPSGVAVAMRPTSLVDEATQGAQGLGVPSSSFSTLGKIPAEAVLTAAQNTAPQNRSTKTKGDGAWAFARVRAPGYYLVTFAKIGYQTQRYVIDSSAAVATEPLSVELTPGDGRLTGAITSARGAVGGATITISDGTNTITTSSNSRGAIGRWSLEGLSTPSAYLVTASKPGMSTESRIVVLRAGGRGVVNLQLGSAATELVGKVSGPDSLGTIVGLGGARVTVHGGGVTRTATTVTNGNLAGFYQLPDLSPGSYTVTMSADGYLPETHQVTIRTGQAQATVNAILTSATAVVVGTVRGVQFDAGGAVRLGPDGKTPLIGPIDGAGITLSSPTNTYKITSSSDGTFRMSGIAPGTYVLSAQFAGLATAYVNVVAVAGQTTRVSPDALLLTLPSTQETSTIEGFVASASPSGTLSCPTGTTPGTDCNVFFTLVDSSGQSVPTRTGDSGSFLATSTTAPAANGPTHYTLSAELGLRAGLYRLTIGASGYLPATVNVRVPRGAVAEAPQVTLFPTNTITGTIDALGSVTNGLTVDGPNPPYTTCVWAVPAGRGIPAPTDCTYTPPKVSTCLTRGIAETGFAIVDPDSLQYTIKDLCDASFDMYVITANPWYVTSVSAQPVTVTHGQTLTYNAHVQRKGRVLLTIAVLDPISGTITPATSLDGTATCTNGTPSDLSTMENSVVIVNGVTASNTVSCAVATTSGLQLNGTVTGLTVGNDTDTRADITMVEQVGSVAGRVVSPYDSSATNPVPRVLVTITGIVGYDGSNPVRVTTSAITDDNGCFAITPQGNQPFDAGGTCGTIAAQNTNRNPMALVVRSVQLSTVGGDGVLPLAPTTVQLVPGTITDVSVTPRPKDAFGLQLQVTPIGPDLSGATVTATPIAATGAGTLSVTVDRLGLLTFVDSKIGTPNQVWPGTYTLNATLPGFGAGTTTMDCSFANPRCTLTGAFQLVQLGTLSGVVIGYQGPSQTFTNGIFTFAYPSHPIAGATVTAVKCAAGQTSPNCSGGTTFTAVTDAAGNFSVSGPNGLGAMDPGSWQVTLSAPGYDTFVQPITIASGANSLARNWLFTTPVDFRVGIQTSAGKLFSCKKANPTCATVSLFRIDTGQTYSQSAASSDKRYDFADLNPATYLVTITGDGLTQTSTQFTVPLGAPTTTLDVPVALTRNTVSGKVVGPTGQLATLTALNGVSVELGHLDADTGAFVVDQDTDGNDLVIATAANAGVDGTFVFSNVPNGTYVARVNHGATGIPVKNGYGEVITSSIVSVSNGQAVSFPDVALPRITHNVAISVTTTAGADDVAASTVTLTSTSDSSWVLTPQPATSAPRPGTAKGVVDTWQFLAVPFGDWKVSITLPLGHFGTLAGSGPALSCSAGDLNDPVLCTGSPLTVPGTGNPNTPVPTVGYTLDEFHAQLSITVTRLATDPNVLPPANVHVSVDDATNSHSVYDNPTFGVTAKDAFWGRTGRSYSVTTDTGAVNWTAADVSLTSAAPSTAIALTEIGATVTVTVSGLGTDTTATVALTPPTGTGITGPKTPSSSTATTATFKDVPFAAGWTAKATSATHTGTKAFDVAAKTVAVAVAMT